MSDERIVLVDASVFSTLAEIDRLSSLANVAGRLVVPKLVQNELTSDVAARELSARTPDEIEVWDVALAPLHAAASHLGKPLSEEETEGYEHATIDGDIALLALALAPAAPDRDTADDSLVLTDDKPLRKTCKALSIPVSGSIGVLVRAVERGHLSPEDATAALEAMDEVGARLSASLLRRAERLIADAAMGANE